MVFFLEKLIENACHCESIVLVVLVDGLVRCSFSLPDLTQG